MARYIDADMINFQDEVTKADIDKIPTADVAPVIRGTWIDIYKRDKCFLTSHPWECSNCSQRQKNLTDYCPDCGAEMEGTA